MGRIADYVATLTPSEREQFKDLIEECTLREATIHRNAARADLGLIQLAEQHQRLSTKIRDLEQAGQRLMDTVSRMYLQTVPKPSKLH
ncbi:MAG TPA: hypothetical protein VGK32_09370 [Vicinamibacterales bacterium]|jgi:hypothetical protein